MVPASVIRAFDDSSFQPGVLRSVQLPGFLEPLPGTSRLRGNRVAITENHICAELPPL